MPNPNRLAVPALLLPLLGLACSSGNAARPEAGAGGSGGAQSAKVDASRESVPVPPVPIDGPSTDGSSDPNESPGIFVAVGYGGRRIRSTDDGVSWTDNVQIEANGGDDNDLLRTVIWGNQEFVALGWRTMTSPDGKTWTDVGLNNLNLWVGAAAYAQGQYVALGGYGLRATSPDALTWKNHSIDTIAIHAGDALVYVSATGTFAGANDNGLRSYSTDGVTWSSSTGATATVTTELAYGGGVLVSLGGTAVAVSRDGGLTWSAGGSLGSSCQGLVFAQGHFTARASGHIFTSTDGQTWTDHPIANMAMGPIAYGHGSYVLVNGSGSGLSRSTDGLNWGAVVPIPGAGNALNWVTFGPTG
jgi:hypothetical protein